MKTFSTIDNSFSTSLNECSIMTGTVFLQQRFVQKCRTEVDSNYVNIVAEENVQYNNVLVDVLE